MRKKKPPQLGDYIEHTCRLNGTFQGTVVQLLGMQFVYETGDGNTRFCLYSCLLYTSPSPRDATLSRMPSSA